MWYSRSPNRAPIGKYSACQEEPTSRPTHSQLFTFPYLFSLVFLISIINLSLKERKNEQGVGYFVKILNILKIHLMAFIQ